MRSKKGYFIISIFKTYQDIKQFFHSVKYSCWRVWNALAISAGRRLTLLPDTTSFK